MTPGDFVNCVVIDPLKFTHYALQADSTFNSEDKFGKRYTVDLLIEGTKGQKVTVRTGWLVSSDDDKAHLVTIYVKKR